MPLTELIPLTLEQLRAGCSVVIHARVGSGYSMVCDVVGLPASNRSIAVPRHPAAGQALLLLQMRLTPQQRDEVDAEFGDGAGLALAKCPLGFGWLLKGEEFKDCSEGSAN